MLGQEMSMDVIKCQYIVQKERITEVLPDDTSLIVGSIIVNNKSIAIKKRTDYFDPFFGY